MKLPAFAGGATFAHLMGRSAKATKAEEDEDDKRKSKRAVSDEDDEKGDGDDEGDGPEDGKSKKGKRAEGPEKDDDEKDDERADDEKDDAKKSKKAKAKRAKAEDDEGDDGESGDEEGDDDSDGADMRKKGARSARMRERARCSAIFADASAGKNPALAAQLAFGTDLPRTQAVNVLRAGGLAVASAPRRPSLDERMAAVRVPAVGLSDAPQGGAAPDVATQVIVAGMKRRGEKPEAIDAFLNSRR